MFKWYFDNNAYSVAFLGAQANQVGVGNIVPLQPSTLQISEYQAFFENC